MDLLRAAACLPFLALAPALHGADPAWPPPAGVEARIDTLRHKLGDASATPADRAKAREELLRLLMNPDAPASRPPGASVPRAAVDLLPSMVKPATVVPPPRPPLSPVAPPSRPALPVPDARGGTVVPVGPNAVDPRTGRLLLEAGNGYVDPATGRFVPRP